jgi:hypothetical protein
MEQNYRVGQRVRVDGYREATVCDVREDGTAYASAGDNERMKISDKGTDARQVEKLVPGRCKCMAATYEEHLVGVHTGTASPHVYGGFFWRTQSDTQETE